MFYHFVRDKTLSGTHRDDYSLLVVLSIKVVKNRPVGQKKANAFGLYGMSRNMWEWVWDS